MDRILPPTPSEAGLARLVREHDWAATPLGPPGDWPQPVRTLVGVMLGSSQPMFLVWGPERTLLYNDAYAEVLQGKHPAALGRPFLEVWHEVQGDLAPIVETTYGGTPVHSEDIRLLTVRRGAPEEAHFAFSCTPVRHEDGRVGGLFGVCQETTGQVLVERRLRESEARARAEAERVQLALDAGAIRGTWTLFAEEGRFVCDELCARTFGLDPAEARRGVALERVLAAVHPEDLPELARAIREVLEQGGHSSRSYRVTGQDGATRWIEASGRAFPGPDGRTARLTGIIIDLEERRAVEAERDRARKLLETFAEAVPGVVYAKDREGRFLVGNRGTTELLGVPPGRYLGRTDAEVLADKAQATALMATDRRIMERGVAEALEEEVRLPDGTPAVWFSTKAPLRDAAGAVVGLIGASIDITARKAAEAALAESEERFRFALEAAGGIGTWDWDVAADRVHTSPQFARMYGVDPARAQAGLPLEEYVAAIHPEDRAEVGRLIAEAVAMGGDYWAEYRILGGDGQVHWVIARGRCLRDGEGRPMRFPGVTFDITSRKAAEAALRESEARFRNMADHAPVMLWVTGPDGMATYLNRQWRDYTGQGEVEALGLGWLEATHPDDRSEAERAFLEANVRREPFRLEFRLRRADGAYRWALDAAAPRFGPDGAFLGYIGSVLDITDRRMAEESLREINALLELRVGAAIAEREAAERALRQSQKMEAVGQLTGGIAHDFNNMLAAVIGSLDLLQRRLGAEDARARRYVEAAMEGARRAATLTQRLLAFARQQPLRPEPLEVDRLVRGMSDLLRRSLGAGIRLEARHAVGLWTASADPNQLENAILNLAVNARDAMPEGGRLAIETANAEVGPQGAPAHPGVPPGSYVTVAVADTGEGMSPEVASKAFDPFFTTKPVGQGTGLGLSQVYGFVRQSGGQVRIDSAPGRGTTVTLYLPRLGDAPAPEPPEAPPAMPPRRGASEVVLVVEDEEVVRRFTAEAMRELGYEVIEAEGAATALRLLDAHPEVALLFTDIVMPETSGHRLAEEALRRRPELRVVFTSGYARDAEVRDGVNGPAAALLAKPFTVEALAAAVRAALDRRT